MENNNDKKTKEEIMAGKYLDPKADLTFKLVFGEHKDLVMSLLNASKAVVRQLKDGEGYNLIQPVYCLNFVNDIGFKSEPDEFYHDYAIVNVAHSDRIIEGLRFVFVELPKFRPESIAEKKMAVLWLRFLTEINRKTSEAPAELLANEATRKALSLVEKSAMSEAQLYAYDKFWMAVTDEAGFLEARYQRGMTEGMEKGRAEGREEGRAEGITQGKEEASRESARKMKAKGYDLGDIAEITGFSVDEVEKL